MKVKTSARKTIAKKVVKTPKKESVKKVAKAPKKTTVKKVNAKAAKKNLVFADNQTSFWVTNGQILNSLVALRDALDAMEKEVYLYHAGEMHNDFANWVSDVLCDASCAADLAKAKTPIKAKTVVVKHLKTYAV